MRALQRILLMILSLLVPTAALVAQAPPDPAGHWEGFIQAPDRQVTVEIDVAKNSAGQLAGTFTQPGDGIKGLPLAAVVQDGRTVRLVLRAGSGGGTFNGSLSVDGELLEGDFVMNEGGVTLPFALKNTGGAIIASLKSPSVTKEFEGTWHGSLNVGGKEVRLSLTLANHEDGTATGTVFSPQAGGIDIPVAITQKDTSLTIDVPSVSASFTGVLNPQEMEIAGTWTQRGGSLPLTLKR